MKTVLLKFWKFFSSLILFIWQFPQHIAAGIVFLYVKVNCGPYTIERLHDRWYIWGDKQSWGVSLGSYIFLSSRHHKKGNLTILHEYGHSIQSLYFGPLYLFAVGIPSAIFANLWDRMFHGGWTWSSREVWYYSRYPEAWADRLGGVKRWV